MTSPIPNEELQAWLDWIERSSTPEPWLSAAIEAFPAVIRELQATRAERDTMREQCIGQIETIAKLRDEGDRLLAYSDHHRARTETAERELQAARKALAEMTNDAEHLLNIIESKAEREWDYEYQRGRIDAARATLPPEAAKP